MIAFWAIVWTLCAALYGGVLAMRPARTQHSRFEAKRRNLDTVIRREKLLADIRGLRRMCASLFAIAMAFAGFAAWHGFGIAATAIVVLVAGAFSRWKPFHTLAMKAYTRLEPALLDTFERLPFLGEILRAETFVWRDQKLESIEQLRHTIETAGHIVSPDQQAIMQHGLAWHTTPISDIMTPAQKIISVAQTELLGPLVLDDLYKSGHDRFVVTGQDINDIVGVLDVTQAHDVTGGKRSRTVEEVMSPQVLRIDADKALPAALTLLERSHAHMLVVINADGQTVGLVTFADITQSLLGKNRGE